ncbi:MAG: hypothetical protein ACLPUO_15370 [Streptosporangiaceae bacterium]|jgi:hypothetical protein
MQLRMKLAAVGAAAALALAAGVPALASSHAAASKSVTGPEVLAGAVHGKAALANTTRIPLAWRGLVNTHSVAVLGGGGPKKGQTHSFPSGAGKLTVRVTAKPTVTQFVNKKTCRFSFTQDIVVKVVGGKSTGAFAGSSGPGAVQVSFAATAPRFKSGPKKGQCNGNAEPLARGAVATFLGSFVLTVR